MTIPLADLKAQYQSIKSEIDLAIDEVLNQTNFILGDPVRLLEEELAEYFGVKYAVGVASGTDALVLALHALGIGKGDEVIATPFTFIATVESILRVGATPVFCDIDPKTYNLDHKILNTLLTRKTKAIIPVHLYGNPCNMTEICKLAHEYKIHIVEDCAQSFGAEHNNKKTGAFGDCGCLSFFPGKTMGCYGDGGMVLTNNSDMQAKLKMLRNHGSLRKYYYDSHGYNSRLDTIQAAVLRVKTKYIDGWIDKRINNANYYKENIKNKKISVQEVYPESKHGYNYFVIRIEGTKRESLMEQFKAQGISCAIYYPLSLHLQKICQDLGYTKGSFPCAESAQDELLAIPLYPELSTKSMDLVLDLVNRI